MSTGLELLRQINFRLDENLSVPEIESGLNRVLLNDGKRVRPYLCLLFGRILGVPDDELIPYARAAEWVHAATLVHDDVVDDSKLRRGKPSFAARFGNSRAVLAGDLLLSRVMVDLSSLGSIPAISSLSNVIQDIVRGEWLQLEGRGVVDVPKDHIDTVARLKTGRLIGWACSAPAIISNASTSLTEACDQIGQLFGFGFQLIDDSLDFQKNGEKPFAHDLTDGLVNSVVAELLLEYPEHRSKISELLFKNPIEAIWADHELQAACSRVRARARAVLLRAHELFTPFEELAARNGALLAYRELSELFAQAHERSH